jgi:hypothetical protein
MSESYDYSEFKEPVVGDSTLAQITRLAVEQKRLEAQVAKEEEQLQKTKDQLRDVAEFKLPALMDSIQMTKFVLADGSEIEIKETLRCGIPKGQEAEAFRWLEKNKHDGLIKRQFTIDFDKDQEEWAAKFSKELTERDDPVNFKCKRSVHPQTLAAFVKEQLEEGIDIPMATFGVFRQRTTKIKD